MRSRRDGDSLGRRASGRAQAAGATAGPLARIITREYTEGMESPGVRAPAAAGRWATLAVALALRALVNPRLAYDLIRLAWSFRARAWWRRAPFLPLPPREYMRWRMFTAYGDADAVPPANDVVRFARWRRETMGL